MIHVYYGNGKGKSTVAAGLAARASGAGMSVWLTHFLKGNSKTSGEDILLSNSSIEVTVFQDQQHPFFVAKDKFDHKKISVLIEESLIEVEKAIDEKRYHLIVLDEILNALNADLTTVDRVLSVLDAAGDIELVLTGRTCDNRILDKADYVSEIKEVKHPYKNGILARKGIEY